MNATPGDKLLKMLRHTESKFMISEDFRIKFVPKAGVKLKSILQRKTITKQTCNSYDGKPCVISDGKEIQTHECRKNRVNYFSKCKNCDSEGKERIYFGETARNLHVRSQEHYGALKNKCRTSFMHKHILEEHNNQPCGVEFEWGIVGKFVKPLERQLSEALCIEETPMHESLNSRKEYFHHDVNRIGLIENQRTEECDYCSRKFETMIDLEKHEKQV